MRLIDADALLNRGFPTIFHTDYGDAVISIEDIKNAPTVDIKDEIAGAYNEGYMCGNKEAEEARLQGHWVKDDAWRNGEYIGGYWHINCPCVDGYSSKVKYNFCPNCGAKMKGGVV